MIGSVPSSQPTRAKGQSKTTRPWPGLAENEPRQPLGALTDSFKFSDPRYCWLIRANGPHDADRDRDGVLISIRGGLSRCLAQRLFIIDLCHIVSRSRVPAMENVSRKDLYTNFEKRLKYLQSYLKFGDGMLVRLNGWPLGNADSSRGCHRPSQWGEVH